VQAKKFVCDVYVITHMVHNYIDTTNKQFDDLRRCLSLTIDTFVCTGYTVYLTN